MMTTAMALLPFFLVSSANVIRLRYRRFWLGVWLRNGLGGRVVGVGEVV